MPKRRTYPRPQLLAQFERSGLSQIEYCKQQDINPKYFSLMRSKHQVVENDRAFAKVVVQPEFSPELSTLPGLVVELGHCIVHCPPNLPISSLVALVNMLRGNALRLYLLLLLGTVITATATNVIHVTQGLIIDDWSGVHPYNSLVQTPILIAVGFAIGMLGDFVLRVMKNPLPREGYGFFKIGLISGIVGISGPLHSYFNSVYADYFVVLIVFFVSLLSARSMGRSCSIKGD